MLLTTEANTISATPHARVMRLKLHKGEVRREGGRGGMQFNVLFPLIDIASPPDHGISMGILASSL